MEENNSSSIYQFVSTQRKLLGTELNEEVEEGRDDDGRREESSTTKKDRQNNKNSSNDKISSGIHNLSVSEVTVGLFGRTIINFHLVGGVTSTTAASSNTNTGNHNITATNGDKNSSNVASAQLLPSHRMTVGDEVKIFGKRGESRSDDDSGRSSDIKKKKIELTGVICKVTDEMISVALSTGKSKHKNISTNTTTSTSSTKTTNKVTEHNKNSKGNSGNGNNKKVDDSEVAAIPEYPISIVPRSSAEVHRKMMKSLLDLEKFGYDHPLASRIITKLFPLSRESSPLLSASLKITTNTMHDSKTARNMNSFHYTPFNESLDQSQQDAVKFALSSNDIALIHGPPGTGKTTTVAELIMQAVRTKQWKVLVCAPSNVAVDNILERIVSAHEKTTIPIKSHKKAKLPRMVRLGHPARLHPSVLQHSLEALIRSADGTEIVNDCRNEMKDFMKLLTNSRTRYAERKVAQTNIRQLRKEIRSREEKVVEELLQTRDIVLCTNVGASSYFLKKLEFDLVVIDEAAQALEASCWIPILHGKRLVLAGDHKQLPPTIKSRAAQKLGLGVTLFDRALALHGKTNISRMLSVQYRMHQMISTFVSDEMYDGKLETAPSVAKRSLQDLSHVIAASSRDLSITTKPTFVLVDTAGCDMEEESSTGGVEKAGSGTGSKFNKGEAIVVQRHVHALIEAGLKENEIAVITPYNGQVDLLKSLLKVTYPKLEIRSVDGFQGGEKEAVVLSLVRSNSRHVVGFLADERRLNVAITRAKRQCFIVCDSDTVGTCPFLKKLITFVGTHGTCQSAMEYVVPMGVASDVRTNTNIMCDGELRTSARSSSGVSSYCSEDLITTVRSKPSSILNNKEPVIIAPIPRQLEGGANQKGNNTNDDFSKEKKRACLKDQIKRFARLGKAGDEHVCSDSLSSYDRMLVHEVAEEIGLGHRSEGQEGMNRRVILWILDSYEYSGTDDRRDAQKRQALKENNDQLESFIIRTGPNSSKKESMSPQQALENDCAQNESVQINDDNQTCDPTGKSEKTEVGDANLLLKNLAQDRIRRQQQAKIVAEIRNEKLPTPIRNENNLHSTSNNKKKKKKSGKKKTKNSKTAANANASENELLVDLDDMAFLDSQIEKVQNSHGRTIEAPGSTYRTILNGVLLTKPKPAEKKKNTNASMALKQRLKDAERNRKQKQKERG